MTLIRATKSTQVGSWRLLKNLSPIKTTIRNKPIITLLQTADAAELETVANDPANSVWLDGLRAEAVKESLDEDAAFRTSRAPQSQKSLSQRISCRIPNLPVSCRFATLYGPDNNIHIVDY